MCTFALGGLPLRYRGRGNVEPVVETHERCPPGFCTSMLLATHTRECAQARACVMRGLFITRNNVVGCRAKHLANGVNTHISRLSEKPTKQPTTSSACLPHFPTVMSLFGCPFCVCVVAMMARVRLRVDIASERARACCGLINVSSGWRPRTSARSRNKARD